MINILSACTDSGFLSVIYFIKEMMKIVFLILPIVLIVMVLIDLFKNVIAKNSDDMKKNTNTAIKRILYCVFAFFVPTIVNLIINAVYDLTSDNGTKEVSLACWTNANKSSIIAYRAIEQTEKLAKEEQKKQEANDKYNQNQQEIENNKIEGGLGGNNEETGNTNIDTNIDNNTTSSNGSSNTTQPSTADHYTIYVGDSRTHTMCINAGVWDFSGKSIKDKEDCITGPGKNYSWYKKTALELIKKEISSHPMANIVINMGTNDVSPNISSTAAVDSAKKYAELHKELAKNYSMVKVVVVSITPFDEEKSGAKQYKLTNDLVEKFNNTMKENISGSRIVFCDVTSKLEGKFSTYDGIHHGAEVNKLIYEEIRKCL